MKNKDKFAVIKLGGKQHLVHENDVLEVNRLETEPKNELIIEDVLLVQNGDDIKVGTPLVSGSKVLANVLEHKRGEKVFSSTFKAKSRQRRKVGHRQELTKIQITKIS